MGQKKNTFQEGTSGNYKGRPPKFLSNFTKQIIDDYLDAGQSIPNSTEKKEFFKALLICPKKRLIEIAQDENAPIFLSLTAKELLTNKKAMDYLLEIEYYCYGKPAQQQVEVSSLDQTLQNVKRIIIEHTNKDQTTAPDDYK